MSTHFNVTNTEHRTMEEKAAMIIMDRFETARLRMEQARPEVPAWAQAERLPISVAESMLWAQHKRERRERFFAKLIALLPTGHTVKPAPNTERVAHGTL